MSAMDVRYLAGAVFGRSKIRWVEGLSYRAYKWGSALRKHRDRLHPMAYEVLLSFLAAGLFTQAWGGAYFRWVLAAIGLRLAFLQVDRDPT